MHRPPHDDRCSCDVETHGDQVNVALARHLEARRFRLIGCLDEAKRLLAALDPTSSMHELAVAGIAMRRLRTKTARVPLAEPAEALVTLAMMSPTLRRAAAEITTACLICVFSVFVVPAPFSRQIQCPKRESTIPNGLG